MPLFVPQLEEQVSRLQREKNDLQSRMEEDQEDMNELMKKHKAAVAQVTSASCSRALKMNLSLTLRLSPVKEKDDHKNIIIPLIVCFKLNKNKQIHSGIPPLTSTLTFWL